MATNIAKYLQQGGVNCPHCQSQDIEGQEVDINAGRAYQNCDCAACGATWTDVYMLADCDHLEIPNGA